MKIILEKKYEDLMIKSDKLFKKMQSTFGNDIAQYVVPFGFNIRYSFNLNIREAFHMIELRTQKQGHTNYRKICQKMFRLIESKHPFISNQMIFTDLNSYEFSREDSEVKLDLKLNESRK